MLRLSSKPGIYIMFLLLYNKGTNLVNRVDMAGGTSSYKSKIEKLWNHPPYGWLKLIQMLLKLKLGNL